MGADTKIGWCDHTFNPWWGCTRVSPGCQHCYAETFSKRVGLKVWGNQAERRFFGEKHWNEPRKWNAAAAKAGKRARVFCASMADVFEWPSNRSNTVEAEATTARLYVERERLFQLIEETPNLDYLLLTKRIENVRHAVPPKWLRGFPSNVWIGTTVEDRKRASERLPILCEIPARVRFISVEPQLEDVSLTNVELVAEKPPHGPRVAMNALTGLVSGPDDVLPYPVNWVICGGESGPKSRPFDVSWARSLLAECRANGVPFFMKQLGSAPVDSDTLRACGLDVPWPSGTRTIPGHPPGIRTKHSKGEDMAEWPADLRVQEWPA